jgi:putative Holliday junction resolvase
MILPRALAIDFGEKRVGLAVSDSLGIAATPIGVLEGLSQDQVTDRIAALARDRGIGVLVVGLPVNMDGTEHRTASHVRARAEAASRRAGLPVEYVDERLTTVQAERHLREAGFARRGRRERVDRVAAALLLQTWLASRRAPPPQQRPSGDAESE